MVGISFLAVSFSNMQGGRGTFTNLNSFPPSAPNSNQQVNQYRFPQQPASRQPGQVLTPLGGTNPNPQNIQPQVDKNNCYRSGFSSKQDIIDRLALYSTNIPNFEDKSN